MQSLALSTHITHVFHRERRKNIQHNTLKIQLNDQNKHINKLFGQAISHALFHFGVSIIITNIKKNTHTDRHYPSERING